MTYTGSYVVSYGLVYAAVFFAAPVALTGWPLDMPAKFETHRREQLVGEIRLAARAEALV
jgi:hypothetical protein